MKRYLTICRESVADLFDKWAQARRTASENTARAWSFEIGLVIHPDQLGSLHRLNLAVADIQHALAGIIRSVKTP